MDLVAVAVLCAFLLQALTLALLLTFGICRLCKQDASVRGLLMGFSQHFICNFPEGRAAAQLHETQCRLLVSASAFFLVTISARFVALQYRYFSSLTSEISLVHEMSSLAMYILSLSWFACGRMLISPRTLDAWSILGFICVFPMQMAEERQSLTSLLSHGALGFRLLFSLTARRFWLACLCNVIYFLTVQARSPHRPFTNDRFSEAFINVAIFWLAYIMRQHMYSNSCMALQLKNSTVGLESALRLLRGFCDAVVELDESLTLCGDFSQLSTMLLHGRGEAGGQSRSNDFISYFCPADRDHIAACLRQDDSTPIPQALHAKMMDSLSNQFEVELLHIRYRHPEGHLRQLVGVREFPDLSAVAPLSDILEGRRRSRDSSTGTEKELSVLLFDTSSFDVLALDAAIGEAVGLATGADVGEGLALHQILRKRECSQLQEVFNEMNLEDCERRISVDLDLNLQWGRGRHLRVEHDAFLCTWVCSLFVEMPALPPTLDTNSAFLEFAPSSLKTRKSRPSRMLRSSRRNGRRNSDSGSSREGSIAELHTGSLVSL
ncbi:unnamed protein product [Symbiodinium natans]|uniref:Uncharacterized protein n=1 Tax=Symbiodinium natans TaxID=878477 RepID=A0A812K587_9DINO|nr:unnamed protein product [Symbiodinium natans]